MIMKVLNGNAVPSVISEKMCGQTNKHTNKQTNKQLEDTSVDVDSRRLTIIKLFKIN